MQKGCQFHIKFHEEFKNELYFKFCRSYIIRYEVILHVKLSYFSFLNIKRQLEITDINFRRIYEDNRSLPNNADRKSKFEICKMDVNFI